MMSTSSQRSSSSASRRRAQGSPSPSRTSRQRGGAAGGVPGRPPRRAPSPSESGRGPSRGSRQLARGRGTAGASGGGRRGGIASLPRPVLAIVAVAILALVSLAVLLVLSNTPAFTITSIDADPTDHISADTIAKLAKVDEGTTLLNVNTEQVVENVEKNPWVESVAVVREFPDRLRIVVTERQVKAIVLMSSGSIAWYLGDDGTWIEPVSISASGGQSAADAALSKANEVGCLLITDVPSSVSPVAGSVATDDSIATALSYVSEFSSDLSSQIASFSAASSESVSCTLTSGVEISLGAATNIASKEAVIDEILSTYPGQVTYINVRVPSKPTYRKVTTTSVQAGSGTSSSSSTSSSESASSSADAGTTTDSSE